MATVNVINCGNASLPRSLDVQVTVTRPGAEVTTDLSVPVFVQAGGGFDFGAGRLAFYSTSDAVNDDLRVTAQGRLAARDFFAQPRRARRMAIGQVFAADGVTLLESHQTAAASLEITSSGSVVVEVFSRRGTVYSTDAHRIPCTIAVPPAGLLAEDNGKLTTEAGDRIIQD